MAADSYFFCTQSCLISPSRRAHARRRRRPPPTFTGSAGVEIRGSASLFASSHQSGAIIATVPFHPSFLPSFLSAYHITAIIPSSHLDMESKHVGPGERGSERDGRSFGLPVVRRPSVRWPPPPPSVRLSVVHRPSGFGAVGGDEVTHSNAKARPSVVCLGRTRERQDRLTDGRSLGQVDPAAAGSGGNSVFGGPRPDRDDRSPISEVSVVNHSLTRRLRRRWADADWLREPRLPRLTSSDRTPSRARRMTRRNFHYGAFQCQRHKTEGRTGGPKEVRKEGRLRDKWSAAAATASNVSMLRGGGD